MKRGFLVAIFVLATLVAAQMDCSLTPEDPPPMPTPIPRPTIDYSTGEY